MIAFEISKIFIIIRSEDLSIDILALYLIISQYCLFAPFICFCFIFVLGQKKKKIVFLFFLIESRLCLTVPKLRKNQRKLMVIIKGIFFVVVCFLFMSSLSEGYVTRLRGLKKHVKIYTHICVLQCWGRIRGEGQCQWQDSCICRLSVWEACSALWWPQTSCSLLYWAIVAVH